MDLPNIDSEVHANKKPAERNLRSSTSTAKVNL
jgi:hypothetical protein